MKRITISLDGTWNTPDTETNVFRFCESVEEPGADGIEQLRWYRTGVGTKKYDRYLGGAIGLGISEIILEAYEYLSNNYEDGDHIYVVGFSRGAYAARSLVGLIRKSGLVRPGASEIKIVDAYKTYLHHDDGPDSARAVKFRQNCSREISIRFLGVWDTVGSLGLPTALLQAIKQDDNPLFDVYRFHDTQLSRIVENAYHAIALDEHRLDFDVCLWAPTEKLERPMEQRWFPGAHCDVGGGYADRTLSDVPLRWMQDKASQLGLTMRLVDVGVNNYRGPATDSYAVYMPHLQKHNPRHLRAVLTTEFGNEVLDPAIEARRRAADLAYKPKNPGLPTLA